VTRRKTRPSHKEIGESVIGFGAEGIKQIGKRMKGSGEGIKKGFSVTLTVEKICPCPLPL
jgi:hypothetical protein